MGPRPLACGRNHEMPFLCCGLGPGVWSDEDGVGGDASARTNTGAPQTNDPLWPTNVQGANGRVYHRSQDSSMYRCNWTSHPGPCGLLLALEPVFVPFFQGPLDPAAPTFCVSPARCESSCDRAHTYVLIASQRLLAHLLPHPPHTPRPAPRGFRRARSSDIRPLPSH